MRSGDPCATWPRVALQTIRRHSDTSSSDLHLFGAVWHVAVPLLGCHTARKRRKSEEEVSECRRMVCGASCRAAGAGRRWQPTTLDESFHGQVTPQPHPAQLDPKLDECHTRMRGGRVCKHRGRMFAAGVCWIGYRQRIGRRSGGGRRAVLRISTAQLKRCAHTKQSRQRLSSELRNPLCGNPLLCSVLRHGLCCEPDSRRREPIC